MQEQPLPVTSATIGSSSAAPGQQEDAEARFRPGSNQRESQGEPDVPGFRSSFASAPRGHNAQRESHRSATPTSSVLQLQRDMTAFEKRRNTVTR